MVGNRSVVRFYRRGQLTFSFRSSLMDSLDNIFQRFPTLSEAFRDRSWMREFDGQSLSRAKGYADGRHITSIRMKEYSRGVGMISAEIQGSTKRPYRAEIRFRTQGGTMHLEPDHCSCPVMYECKHLAAVMLFLEKRAAKHHLTSTGVAQTGIDWQMADWLKRFEEAAAADHGIAAAPKPYNKILAYCIEKEMYRDWLMLTIRVGTVKKSGEVSLASSYATADLSKPPQYMSDEDFLLVSRLRRFQRARFDYGGIPLEGEGVGKFLEDVLATGRLFVIRDTNFYSGMDPQQVLEAGPPETINAIWEQLDDGKMRPALKFSREGMRFTSTDPVFYVDFAKGVFGKITSDFSGKMLALWDTGPTVSTSVARPIGEKLRAIPGRSIPPPIELAEELIPDAPLHSILRIRRTEISGEQTIVANPFFRYGGSPEIYPTDDAIPVKTHTQIRDEKRLIWTRDPEKESKMLTQLIAHGLDPISSFIRPEFLGKQNRHAFVREESMDLSDVESWISFLEGAESNSLRELGWEILADPKAGLTVRDVTDIFPEIETEQDHGIDWFRFDVSGELDGKKFSLIPHIAKAISDGILESESPVEPDESSSEATILIPCD